jgi:hypothetical protein
MEMTRRIGLYVLAVVVLTASMAVAALADDHGMNTYGPSEQGVGQSIAGEIRGPVETGALPDRSVQVDSEGWVNIDVSEQNRSPELWGRPNIQSGGGGA